MSASEPAPYRPSPRETRMFHLLSAGTIALAGANLLLQVAYLLGEGQPGIVVAAATAGNLAYIALHLASYRIAETSPLAFGVIALQALSLGALVLVPSRAYFTYFLFLAVEGQTILYLPQRGWWWASAMIWAVIAGSLAVNIPIQADPQSWVVNVLSLTLGLLFTALVSYLARLQMQLRAEMEQSNERLRQSHQELEEAHRRLQAYAAQVEELAAMRERNRLAQEIHDTLAHTLTGLILQLEVVASLLEGDGSQTGPALDAVRKAVVSAREGLAEVRRAVRSLYPDLLQGVPLADSLRRLASQFAEQTGIAVRWRETGTAVALSRGAANALYRSLQEALTNAGRHGSARRIDVVLEWSPEAVRLSIYDDGAGAKELTPGFGLSSMQERVEALGGTVRIDNRPGEGFGVTVTVPASRALTLTGCTG
ncbi:sensor histidine kinase [Carboxydochorda subterranea]|uniref:histidine kinase n=1 Tax=Carboxydichorda subterranea TaxID=3109565 RepID=A0ABZ1BXA9_9FIRM|nr:sensor histidine kinase [Limnochorda sp. L945t]WRP17223.1 sensor histidine kinase [Limnochorda sp. L945t]